MISTGSLRTFSVRLSAAWPSWQALSLAAIAVLLGALAIYDGGRDQSVLIMVQGVIFAGVAVLAGTGRIPRVAITDPALLTLAAVLMTSIWTVRLQASLESLLLWTMCFGITFIVAAAITTHTAARRFLDALVVIASGLALFAAFTFWGSGNAQMRWYSTFYWPNPFAAFLLLVLPFTLIRFLQASWLRDALTHGCTSTLLIAALVFTYSRGAWVTLALVAPLILILVQPPRWGTALVRIGLLAAVVSIVVVTLPRTVVPTGTNGALAARAVSVVDQGDYSIQGRLNFWRAALAIFRDHPLVGTGPGTFSVMHGAYQQDVRYYARDVHNFYIQMLAEMGIVGFAAMLVLGWSIWAEWKRTLQAARGREEFATLVGVGLGAFTFFLHIAFDMDWTFPAIPATAFALLGVLASHNASSGVPRPDRAFGVDLEPRGSAHLLDLRFQLAFGLVAVIAIVLTSADWAARRQFAGGQEAAQRSEWASAADHYTAAARWTPFTARYFDAAAWALSHTADPPPPLARDLLRQAIRVDPANEAWPFHLALVLMSEHSASARREAETLLRRALTLDRFNRPVVYRTLARLYKDEGRLDDAEHVYEEATALYLGKNLSQGTLYLMLWPEVVKLFQDAATFSADRGQVGAATQYLEQLLADDPTAVDAVLQLTALYVQVHRPANARALLERATRQMPADPRLVDALKGLP